MEAEQKIDDLKLSVNDLQSQSNRLEIESINNNHNNIFIFYFLSDNEMKTYLMN